MAALGATQPGIEALLLGQVRDAPQVTLVHPALALESGDAYRAHLERAADGGLRPTPPKVLIVLDSLGQDFRR